MQREVRERKVKTLQGSNINWSFSIYKIILSRQMRETVSRAIIIKENKILVCRRKDKDYWFLPGGHVDDGENSKEALIRELKEERGSEIKSLSFAGIIESHFMQDGEEIWEISLIYEAREDKLHDETKSEEDHLEFDLIPIEKIGEINLLPFFIKEGIFDWLSDGKPFYFSSSK